MMKNHYLRAKSAFWPRGVTIVLLFLGFSLVAGAQHLTISTGGQQGTSGTNWSISSGVLTVTGPANVHPNVITNAFSTGNVYVEVTPSNGGGTARDIAIISNIAYTGSQARSLTFKSTNGIAVSSGVSITSSSGPLSVVLHAGSGSNPDNGRIVLDGVTITTNGGHFRASGGANATWNGLTVGADYARTWSDDESGISFVGSTLTTSGGSVYMDGMSYNTSDGDGSNNYGVYFGSNSTISSGTGQIDITGRLLGMYSNGGGLALFGNSGAVTISSTTGAINLTGTGTDQSGTNTGWRRATILYTNSSNKVSVTSTSGNINISGTATFNASTGADIVGLQIGSTTTTADGVKITSQSGGITLSGSCTRENAGQGANALQFIAGNVSNSLRIGYDGTNAYSGNIVIEGNSIYQNNVNAGSGSISMQSTGTLEIRPKDAVFTYLRAGATGTLVFDDDWNFGSNLGGFTFGKSTNTFDLSYEQALTTAGPITFHAKNFTINNDITSSTDSDITINATEDFKRAANTNRFTISSAGGDIIVHADKDAIGGGVLYLGYVTLDPGAGDIILRGENVNWSIASSTDKPYLNGTGSITIEPSDASFGQEIQLTWLQIDQDNNGMAGLTIGKATNTQSITQNLGPLSVTGPVNFYGGAITISSALTAAGNILLDGDPGSFLTQNSRGVTVNAAVTTSNNGNITIIGRGGSGSAQSLNYGVYVTETVEAGGTGTITVTGTGGLSSNGADASSHGVYVEGANAWLKSNDGNIVVTGNGGGAGSGSYSQGVALNTGGRISAGGSGTVTITGTGGVNTAVGLRGVIVVGGSSIYTAGGAISITGNTGTNGSDNSDGVAIDNATIGSNTSGAITIVGTGGGGTGSEAISLSTSNTIGGASYAGNIILRGNTFSIIGSNSVTTTGLLTIEPTGTSFTSALTYPISNLTIAGTVSGLTLGKTTNTANVTVGATTAIAGPVTIYGGTLAINESLSSSTGSAISLYGNALTFAANKTVSSTGALLVAPQTVSNTIGIGGATGTLSLPASYFASNFADGFSSITIGSDNQTGAIASNAFTLQDPVTFKTTGSLTLGGLVTLGANDVTIGNNVSAATGSSSGYFQTNAAGKVNRRIATAASFAFPVGNSAYNPLTIANNTGSADDFSARVADEVLDGGTTGAAITDKVVDRTWHIGKAAANASSGVDMTFQWDVAQERGTLNDYKLSHYGTFWALASGTSGSVTDNSGTKTMTHTGYTGNFSPFAIGSSTGALPVSWVDFTAVRAGQIVELNWRTGSEQNSKDFVVQHSTGNGSWKNIGNVAAAGFSSSERSYRFTHTQPVDGRNLYRLLQRDLDGKESLSKVVGVVMPSATSVQVYPVPSTNGSVFVKLPADQVLKLFSSTGVLVLEQQGKAGVQSLDLQSLPKGLYYLQAGKETVRVMLQ